MKKILNSYRAHMIMGLSFLLLTACVKESNVGSGLLSDQDLLSHSFVDTFSIEASTFQLDSFNTTGLPKVALGEINDLDLGVGVSGFNCQFNLPGNNFTFGSDAVIDSVFIYLKYIAVYGDSSQVHQVLVHQLDEVIEDSVSYYATDDLLATNLLADTMISFNVSDSVTGTNGTELNTIALKLNHSLTDQIIAADGTADLADDDAFHSFIKGLKISVQAAGLSANSGSMARFNLYDADTRVVVFYSSNGSSLNAEFPINSSSRSFISISNDYTGAPLVANQLVDTLTSFDAYALSGIAGLRLRLKFPYLQHLQGSGKSIAKAQLIIPINRVSDVFDNPSELWIQNISTSLYSASSDADNYYIDVSDYVQSVLLDQQSTNYLDIVISDYFENISRTIVNGPDNTNPLRLAIDFTEF